MSEFNLGKLTIKQLVERRNADCMHSGWGKARGRFHVELRNAFLAYGLDIAEFGWHTYIKYDNGTIQKCFIPRFEAHGLNRDGIEYHARNIRAINDRRVDLAALIMPVLLLLEESRTVPIDLIRTRKRFQIVTLDKANAVIGNALAIGHSNTYYTQYVYGQKILMIPFTGSQEAIIAVGQTLDLKRMSPDGIQKSFTRYL